MAGLKAWFDRRGWSDLIVGLPYLWLALFFLLPFLAFEPWRSLPPHDLCDLATQVAFADAVGAGHSSDVR